MEMRKIYVRLARRRMIQYNLFSPPPGVPEAADLAKAAEILYNW